MGNLYYGSGECTLEYSSIRAVLIRYTGSIKILDKTSNSFMLKQKNNKIMIFPIGKGFLDELFEYSGSLNITSVSAINSNHERINIFAKKVMDFSELLNTKAEDLTTVSEKLNSSYTAIKELSDKEG